MNSTPMTFSIDCCCAFLFTSLALISIFLFFSGLLCSILILRTLLVVGNLRIVIVVKQYALIMTCVNQSLSYFFYQMCKSFEKNKCCNELIIKSRKKNVFKFYYFLNEQNLYSVNVIDSISVFAPLIKIRSICSNFNNDFFN